MNGIHCGDLQADRALGEKWEKNFGQLALQHGLVVTAHQIGRNQSACAWYLENGQKRRVILPDVVVWNAPGQHHEIKHKNPTRRGEFGLETYRFDCLRWLQQTTKQPVFYTIHNHDLSGGRNGVDNRLEHWVTASVSILEGTWARKDEEGDSLCNGRRIQTEILYWETDLFVPLACVLNGEFQGDVLSDHPTQIELTQTKADLLEAQEQIAALKRQRVALIAQYKNSVPPKPRYSADGAHSLAFAFE
jgi:hypothetical protein